MLCRMCGKNEVDKNCPPDFPLMCSVCIFEWKQDAEKIAKHIRDGHSRHCACRLTWGDGECECSKSRRTRKEQADALIAHAKEGKP